MKFFCLAILFCLAGFTGFSQVIEKENKISLPPRTVLRFAPFAVLQGPVQWSSEYRLGLEQVLGSRKSFVVSASYLGHSPVDLVFGKDDYLVKSYSGFRGQVSFRFYRSKMFYSPEGFFIGPHFSYSYLETKATYNKRVHREYLNYANASLHAGYQFIFAEAVTMEFFTGLGIKHNIRYQRDSILGNDDSKETNLKFLLGFSFGFVL